MSITEFNNSELGETCMFIDERKRMLMDEIEAQTSVARLNRLNTVYIMNAFGAKIKKPWTLYQLPGDDEAIKAEAEKMQSILVDKSFENMTLDG